MNRVAVVALAVVALWAAAEAVPAGGYTTKYDNIDLDDILRNERLVKKYVECLLAATDERCTADGKELRRAVPDALTNGCSKCNDKQKSGAEKVIRFLINNRRADWQRLEAKYDPQGTYQKRYQKEAQQHNIKI